MGAVQVIYTCTSRISPQVFWAEGVFSAAQILCVPWNIRGTLQEYHNRLWALRDTDWLLRPQKTGWISRLFCGLNFIQHTLQLMHRIWHFVRWCSPPTQFLYKFLVCNNLPDVTVAVLLRSHPSYFGWLSKPPWIACSGFRSPLCRWWRAAPN